MKIAVFEVERWERDVFEKLNGGARITYASDPLTYENSQDYMEAEAISTFIYSDLSAQVLRQFRNLKFIATRSTGFDHIDTAYCRDRGITVSNVPAYGENTVAEHVFALLLAISHNIIEAADRTRRGNFSLQGLTGFDLRGKTLGVFGTGKIGQAVIEIANGFGMNVRAYDMNPRNEVAKKLGFQYLETEDLLRRSDIITLHLPATELTYYFLSRREFELMKDGVVIINTARGTLIDIQALLHALTTGKVAAAGLDVLPEEPSIREEAELLRSIEKRRHLEELLADHLLLRMRNVVITPHSAFNTKEAVQRILDTTIDNIKGFTEGRPRNVVV